MERAVREVGVLEAKTNLSALIDAVERGGEGVIITRHGKPVARLVATPPQRLSGEALLARFDASHERLRAENPDIDKVTWEEILDWRDG